MHNMDFLAFGYVGFSEVGGIVFDSRAKKSIVCIIYVHLRGPLLNHIHICFMYMCIHAVSSVS